MSFWSGFRGNLQGLAPVRFAQEENVLDQPAPVPVSRFATHSVDEAHEQLERAYVRHDVSVPRDAERLQFILRTADFGVFRLDTLHHNLHTVCHTEPMNSLAVVAVRDGQVGIASGRHETRLADGQLALFPPAAAARVEWQGLHSAVINIPYDLAARTASEIFGIEPEDLRFDSMTPRDPHAARSWNAFMAFLDAESRQSATTFGQPLVKAETARMLAVKLLSTFAHSGLAHPNRRRDGRVAPAVLRRAVAYMEEQAQHPVTVSQIAAAAGVSPRALQLAFSRHFDVSPGMYLRRLRLERAHRELQAADASQGCTVAAIAARWGFAKPGRFTAYYREAYSTLPSHTLRT
ncbi:AraC family transcriptional regulator [Streptomyces sp. NPDC087300]|uniref:AraC family transcriptional regulator n=1 Tax=Streptomyces sp. NPDC087300 TaxID=3365780 RepID=UPI00381A3589